LTSLFEYEEADEAAAGGPPSAIITIKESKIITPSFIVLFKNIILAQF